MSARLVYYAYGQGGNIYYENNIVYVNGQAAGSPSNTTSKLKHTLPPRRRPIRSPSNSKNGSLWASSR